MDPRQWNAGRRGLKGGKRQKRNKVFFLCVCSRVFKKKKRRIEDADFNRGEAKGNGREEKGRERSFNGTKAHMPTNIFAIKKR